MSYLNNISSDGQSQTVGTHIKKVNIDGNIYELGIDTSDANASANQISKGCVAYANGNRIEGTLEERGNFAFATNVGSGYYDGDKPYISLMQFPEGIYRKSDEHFWSPEIRVASEKLASFIGLTPEKIAAGQTILGVTGTFTSDANVLPNQISKGCVVYANGKRIEGTLEERGNFAFANDVGRGWYNEGKEYISLMQFPEGIYRRAPEHYWSPEVRLDREKVESYINFTS